jgi:hypothetical protein
MLIIAFFVFITLGFAWAMPEEEIAELEKRFKK